MDKVSNLPRSELLKHKTIEESKHKSPTITFYTVYSPQFKQVVAIIKKHLLLLTVEDDMRDILETDNLVSPSLHISKNMHERHWLNVSGFFGCGHKRCTACKYANNTDTFQSITNKSRHHIKSFINCNSKCVIYLINYTACKLQYVR